MSRIVNFCIILLVLLGVFGCAPKAPPPAPPLPPLEFSGGEKVVAPVAGVSKGEVVFTSTPFEVTTDEWQLKWSVTPKEKATAVLGVFVYPEGEKLLYLGEAGVTAPAPASGSTYLYTGKGKYYIKVNVFGALASWKVTVVRQPAPVASLPLTLSGEFTGMTSGPFKVTAKECLVKWSAEARPAFGGILGHFATGGIEVYPRGELKNYVASMDMEAGSGTASFKGPGEFYVKVGTQAKKWAVELTEVKK